MGNGKEEEHQLHCSSVPQRLWQNFQQSLGNDNGTAPSGHMTATDEGWDRMGWNGIGVELTLGQSSVWMVTKSSRRRTCLEKWQISLDLWGQELLKLLQRSCNWDWGNNQRRDSIITKQQQQSFQPQDFASLTQGFAWGYAQPAAFTGSGADLQPTPAKCHWKSTWQVSPQICNPASQLVHIFHWLFTHPKCTVDSGLARILRQWDTA